tara:strand:- start:77 stop:337 length:261 start_codon:yes stop_codon:yes gene_type:complete
VQEKFRILKHIKKIKVMNLTKEEVNEFEERETEFTRNRPARIDQFISELDDLLDEYHAELYLKDDVFTGIEAVKRAALGPDTAKEN